MMPVALVAKAVHTNRPTFAAPRQEGENVFERVRQEVDLWKFYRFTPEAEEYDRYYLDRCPSPEHTDRNKSALVFHDAVKCLACGFRASTLDYWMLLYGGDSPYEVARTLLTGNFTLDTEAKQPRAVRTLDQGAALEYHLELATNSDALERLQAFGFTKTTIREFKLGYAEVLARLLPDEREHAENADRIEWRDIKGVLVPFQRQWRFSVPVFAGGWLVQMLYRKAQANDLGPKVQLEYNAGTSYLFNGDALKGQEHGVYCSGWGDALILAQWGIPAASGIAGDGSYRTEWNQLFGNLKRFYSVTDADNAGVALRQRLEREVPWVRHIELPYDIGTKKDVRDYYLEGHTREEFLRLMKLADREQLLRSIIGR